MQKPGWLLAQLVISVTVTVAIVVLSAVVISEKGADWRIVLYAVIAAMGIANTIRAVQRWRRARIARRLATEEHSV